MVGDVNGDGILDVFASATDLDSIQVYDGHTGEYVLTFVPSRLGGLSAPKDLIFSADGTLLYVSSSGNNQVNVYDASTGAFLRSYSGGGLARPRRPDHQERHPVRRRHRARTRWWSSTCHGHVADPLITAGLSAPKGVAFDAAGDLLVTNSGGGNVLKFNARHGRQPSACSTTPRPSGSPTRRANKSQNDAFSNNVYVAWATNSLGDLQTRRDRPGRRHRADRSRATAAARSRPRGAERLEVTTSTVRARRRAEADDQPGPPAGHAQPVGPRRAGGPGDGRLDRFRHERLPARPPIPPTDAIVSDHAQAGVSYSTTADLHGDRRRTRRSRPTPSRPGRPTSRSRSTSRTRGSRASRTSRCG